jgi:hypothetical protein
MTPATIMVTVVTNEPINAIIPIAVSKKKPTVDDERPP